MGKYDAEIKRKAQSGIALTNPNSDKQALYDQTRSQTVNEINRKASEGIALTNQTSEANNQLYANALQPKQKSLAEKPNAQQYIDQLNAAQKQAALSGLDKSRNQSLSNLQQEKSEIQPRYYDARNQTAAGNQQQSRNFAEFMASRGGTNSGANAQAEISQQGTFQSNIGSLNRQEGAAIDNIGRRTTDVNNAYESDVQSANANIEAQRLQSLIAQMNADRGFGMQEAGLTGMYNGQQTLAGQGQSFNQGMANKQFGLQEQGQNFNQDMQTDQFAYQKARDQIGDNQFKQQFDEDSRRFGLNYALDKQVQLGSLSIQQAQLALSQSAAASRSSGGSSSGSGGSSSSSSKSSTQSKPLSTSDMKNYASLIESSSYYDKVNGTVKNEVGLKKYIADLNLSDSETDKLFSRYGLSAEEKASFNPALMPRSLQPLFNGYGR